MQLAAWVRALLVALVPCTASLANDACLKCHANATELAKHQTKKGRPVSEAPASYTLAMWGCSMRARACRSVSKRGGASDGFRPAPSP